MIDREDLGNKKLINSIKNEEYKKLVIRNGHCVKLIDIGREEMNLRLTGSKYGGAVISRKLKITEYSGLYKYNWIDYTSELINYTDNGDRSYVDFNVKLKKYVELDKHTFEGLKKLEDELEFLKTVKRKDMNKKIKVARSFGDLSEDAEYDELKNEHAIMKGRITQLKNMLRIAPMDGRVIEHMYFRLGNTMGNKRLIYVFISNKEYDEHEKIKGIELYYYNTTKKFETMNWHILRQEKNNKYPVEFYVRLDLKNNRGEVYLDVSPKIRMILSMMK